MQYERILLTFLSSCQFREPNFPRTQLLIVKYVISSNPHLVAAAGMAKWQGNRFETQVHIPGFDIALGHHPVNSVYRKIRRLYRGRR